MCKVVYFFLVSSFVRKSCWFYLEIISNTHPCYYYFSTPSCRCVLSELVYCKSSFCFYSWLVRLSFLESESRCITVLLKSSNWACGGSYKYTWKGSKDTKKGAIGSCKELSLFQWHGKTQKWSNQGFTQIFILQWGFVNNFTSERRVPGFPVPSKVSEFGDIQ